MRRNLAVFAAGTALPALTNALLVAEGSPCEASCGNVLDATTSDDIVCGTSDFVSGYNDASADVFQSCLQCEIQSGYATQDNFTDAMAMLYTMRYAVSYCVLNFPRNDQYQDSPCATSKTCGPFVNGLKYMNLSAQYERFQYCDRWPSNDLPDLAICTQCLQASNLYTLANFMTVLYAGCSQKPEPGVTLGILGNVFSNTAVQITSPTPQATINPDWFDHGPLSMGGKVGVAIGCIVFLLMLAGMFIIWRGRKRRRTFLRKLETQFANGRNGGGGDEGAGAGMGGIGGGSGGVGVGVGGGWPSPQRDMGETPMSQRPLRGWDDSPMTLSTEKTFPRYISPYSSQYNSPVSALESHQMAWPEPTLGSPREIGVALAERHQWLQTPEERDRDRERERERDRDRDRDKGKMRDGSFGMGMQQQAEGVSGLPGSEHAASG